MLFLFFAVIISVFLLKWVFVMVLPGFIFLFVIALVIIFWSWRFDFSVIPQVTAGFLMDSVSPFGFGTFMAVFFILSLAAEILKHIFSNIDSVVTKGLSYTILLLLFFSIVLPLDSLFS